MAGVALACGVAVAGPAVARCTGPTCNFDTLKPVFKRLAAARGGQGPGVHILQIGDSHTAGDVTPGAWRDLMQARFGIAGRGVLAPGRPYDGYLTHGVTATMAPGQWLIGATFGKNSAASRPLLGVSGFSLTATRAGATMALSADSAAMAFDRFVLCAIGGPGAGGVTVRFDGGLPLHFDFTQAQVGPACQTLNEIAPRTRVEVTTDLAGLTLTSWATFRDNVGGVAVSNVGVVGSQLMHFARADDAVIAAELAAYRPDLIVLAFGTNEGFTPRFDPVAYEATVRAQIARLRRLSGDVPILLLGAPDALSRNAALRSNADGAPVECESGLAAVVSSATTVQPVPSGKPALFAPPALAEVRRIQRKVAGDLGVAFWDWQARMGGVCSAKGFVERADPLMRGDYVHFKSGGGRVIAQALMDDLDAAGMK
ncbi:MAG: SGNH/GDSL hydrolase family protein [Sphingomonas sp.]|nr:SGNH/GDSL hydrolase family protein [Sphingomonas sp.]